jgi:hypothetical protein
MVSMARKPTKGPFSFTANSPTSRRLGHRSSNTVKIAALSTIILLSYLFYGYRFLIADAVENTHVTDAAAAFFHAPLQSPDLSYGSTDYLPAPSERYVIEHAVELGYDSQEWTKGCTLWGNVTPPEISPGLHALINELRDYNERLNKFQPVSDLRKMLLENDEGGSHNANICQGLELHEKGLQGIFKSGEISLTANGGYVEPLLPPMRHPEYCFYGDAKLLDLGYLVHDFSYMCKKLKRTSKTILIDMGASLDFHERWNDLKDMPAVYLMELYRKFGFPFDHIYAFEKQGADPAQVYSRLPEHWLTSYHWINVGVDADPNSRLNPLKWILDNFEEDDLIVVKLDIDTPAIELPLVMQLLNDDRYNKLVDQFYFEHHVKLYELGRYWTANGATGSIRDSLNLFAGLRAKGIASHFWV